MLLRDLMLLESLDSELDKQISEIRFHVMRKTHGTQIIRSGIDKALHVKKGM